ncbi:hypothetical protein D3C85_1518750 [compost metagenome]
MERKGIKACTLAVNQVESNFSFKVTRMKTSQVIRTTLDSGLYTADWRGRFFCHALSAACKTGIITSEDADNAKEAVMQATDGHYTLTNYLSNIDGAYARLAFKYGHWSGFPYNRRVKWLRRLALTLENQGN